MRYMLLIYGCEGPDSGPVSEAKRTAVRDYFGLLEERGALIAGEPLRGVHTARTVRVREGEALVTDGPFAETVEQLGGYFMLDCKDDEEAMELAARCPMAAEGSIEVRPMLEMPYTVPYSGDRSGAASGLGA